MQRATLRVVLIALALGLWGSLAWATTISWDFENGGWPSGPICCNAVPPVVNATGGNPDHYARLTASPTDCGPTFFTTCPRIRAEAWIGQINDVVGETRTYKIDLRFPSANQAVTGHDSLVWQMVNPGPNSPELRTSWIGTQNGRIYIANPIQPVPHTPLEVNLGGIQGPFPTVQALDLGPLVFDEWHTYVIEMVEAMLPNTGTIKAWRDGVPFGTIAGQATIRSVNYTEIYIDVVSDNGVKGIVDFDNASLAIGGWESPPMAGERTRNYFAPKTE
jgi:hypothetical protein